MNSVFRKNFKMSTSKITGRDIDNSRKSDKPPVLAITVLVIACFMSVLADVLAPYLPSQMDSMAIGEAPSLTHLCGTDNMGRDLLSLIMYGGRASLVIGILSAMISTGIAAVYGTLSGMANRTLDNIMMRATDLLMSIPSILLIIVMQAIWGKASYQSLAIIIGITSWMNIAKIVRGEVRRLRKSEFVLAAELMGGSFWYILRRHLLPNYFSSIMFMAVSNIGSAIITESTLSFMGLGLPLSEVSWGSLMSLSQDALLSDQWWIIVIPGLVLISVLVSITELGEYIRSSNTKKHSNI